MRPSHRLRTAPPCLILLAAAAALLAGGCRSAEDYGTPPPNSVPPGAGEVAPVPSTAHSRALKPVPKDAVAMIGKPIPGTKGTIKGHPGRLVILGDLDGDGRVTRKDAQIAIDIAMSKHKPTALELKAGDLNHDGEIEINEVTVLNSYVQARGGH